MRNLALLLMGASGGLIATHTIVSVYEIGFSGHVRYGVNNIGNFVPQTFEGVRLQSIYSAASDGSVSDSLTFENNASVGDSIKITRIDTGLEAIYTFADGVYYSSTRLITASDLGTNIKVNIELV